MVMVILYQQLLQPSSSSKHFSAMGEIMENESVESKAIELRREYYRKWRERNKDKVKAYNRKKWLKKVDANQDTSEQPEGYDDEHKDNK